MTGSHAAPPPGGVPAGDGRGPGGPGGSDALASPLLALALVLGLVRLVRLGEWSLWIDEVFTWSDAHAEAGRNYNRLGYDLVRWTVTTLGEGPSEFALRLAPAVAGWLMIGATAWAFRPLAGPRRAALAALVVAVSPWAVYWSQNARFYTFVGLTTVLGAGVLLRGLARGRWGLAALGLALCAGAAAFQLQALLVVGVLAAGVAVLAPRSEEATPRPSEAAARTPGFSAPARHARRAGLAGLGLALLASPWAWGVFAEYRAIKGGSLAAAQHGLLTLGAAITPALGAAFVLGGVSALGDRGRRGALAVWMGVGGPLVVVLLGFLARTSAQYAFAFLPWIALVAAWPVGPGGALSRGALASGWAFLLAAPLFVASGLQLGPRAGDRPRWRAAIEYVEARRAAGELVVALPSPVVEFYLSGGAPDVRVPEHVVKLDWTRPRSYERYAADGRPLWLIVRADSLNDFSAEDRARLEDFLRRECRRAAEFEVEIDARNLDVEVWRRE